MTDLATSQTVLQSAAAQACESMAAHLGACGGAGMEGVGDNASHPLPCQGPLYALSHRTSP